MSERARKGELEATQQTVKFFETLLRASADGIVITDAMQGIVVVNEAFCAFFDRPWRDVVETSLFAWLEQLDADAPRRWAEVEKSVRLEGSCDDVEFRMTTKDGVRHLSVNASLLERIADEERGVIISIWSDVTGRKRAEEELHKLNLELEHWVDERTAKLAKVNEQLKWEIEERKQAEEALRESEKKYRLLVQNAPLGIISINTEGCIIEVNPRLLNILGSPSAEATRAINMLTFPPLVEAGIADDFRHCMESEQPGIFERPYVSKWGKELYLRYHLMPIRDKSNLIIGAQAIVEDISQRKKLETQLQQVQKMEAIATLAGGIAHDFNNILTSIMGYTEMAQYDVPEENRAHQSLDQVMKASFRAKDLVKQILAFSRQREQERKPVQIYLIIKEALKFLRASLPTTIEIRQNIPADSGAVLADSTQIHQVIMNLCTNAYHSMRENGGVLEVGLTEEEISSDDPVANLGLNPGRYLKLTVKDTGHGMNSATMSRIFNPYFTTKEKDMGSGLGLAVVDGIVKSHGGAIAIDSEIGKGTAFDVYLPVVETKEKPKTDEVLLLPKGDERILFVDDEETIAEMRRQMLELLGYKVSIRTSSVEALKAFRSKPEKFDLVITDMTMPKMTGAELAKELLKIQPDIPIILCTGFSEHIDEEKANEIGIRALVMKPILMNEIAKTIRKVLDQKIDD